MNFDLAPGQCCLLTDEGTDLTVQTLARLETQGWPVVVLRFPARVVAPSRSPEGTRLVQLAGSSEEDLQTGLAEVNQRYGSPAVFVHLHPSGDLGLGEGLHFTETGKQVLQAVFLLAKHLKEPLNRAAQHGRAALLLAARLDGEFGLGEGDYDPISGGLFGLAKSLNLEWEAVFCRAVDLSPDLNPADAAALLLSELLDPNRRIVEVAHSPNGRTTLALS
jgi:hypothetical protein